MKRITMFGIVKFNTSWKSKICWKRSHNQMAESKQGNTAQHRCDMEAYQAYKCKDRVAHILLLSSMRNDIMLRFERHCLAQAVWDAVKV